MRSGSRSLIPMHASIFLIASILFSLGFLLAIKDAEPPGIPIEIIVTQTRAEAELALREFKEGVSFRMLVREHSVDPTAHQGGYLGRMKPSALRPEIREALRGVKAGKVSGIIETSGGYMIVWVVPEALATEAERGGRTGQLALEVSGINRQDTEVSGYSEVINSFANVVKPFGFDQNMLTVCDLWRQSQRLAMHTWEGVLSQTKAGSLTEAEWVRVMDAEQALGQLEAYQGNVAEALKHFEAEYKIANSQGLKEIQLFLEEQLGATELHRSRSENFTSRADVFPIPANARYTKPSGSEEAVKHFRKYLEQKPDDLEVRWLLNLAYMTLGEYPQSVPPRFLIPPQAFQSEEDIGRFEDVAPSLGLNTLNMAGSVIMDDFDNDGFLALVVSDRHACAPMHYFHNNGDGTFTDRTREVGLGNLQGGANLLQADYNNDGWLDFIIVRGAWEGPMPLTLMKNNGDGTFTDATREAGLAGRLIRSHTAAWADYDNDGNVDLFVGSELGPSALFHNNGDGTFTDVGPRAGVSQVAFTKGVVAGDYDNDGYPDLYVSNLGEENFLYHNNHDGTFTDVAGEMGVQKPIFSFPCAFLDYDNDGWLDIYVQSNLPSVTEVVRRYLRLPPQMETSKLYRNIHGSSFQDVSKETGLDRMDTTMGFNYGDVDNDGFLDFYLGSGCPSFVCLLPKVLLKNKGGKVFVNITTSSGTGALGQGHGMAFGDVFNDGNEDIFAQLGGATPGDRDYSALFKNSGNSNRWITVKLVGMKTNRAAIGARIKVTVKDQAGASRSIYKDVTSGGSFGASPLEQHIGLGKAVDIESLEIWWPTSNTRQIFHEVAPNQFLEIKEFEKEYRKLSRRVIALPANPGM